MKKEMSSFMRIKVHEEIKPNPEEHMTPKFPSHSPGGKSQEVKENIVINEDVPLLDEPSLSQQIDLRSPSPKEQKRKAFLPISLYFGTKTERGKVKYTSGVVKEYESLSNLSPTKSKGIRSQLSQNMRENSPLELKGKSQREEANKLKYYENMMCMARESDKEIGRFPSGDILPNLKTSKKLKQNEKLVEKAQKISEYDQKLRNGRGFSPEQKKVSEIAVELVDKTKNQKNRANVHQLLRGKSLSVCKALEIQPKQ